MKQPVSRKAKIAQAQSGTARAALLGISDGLVTNVSLILGVAAAGASVEVVRIAGIASLIAGACSMAVGEYISMRGQVELLEGVLAEEEEELRSDPERAKGELQSILEQDGVTTATAQKAAGEVARGPKQAMAVYARGKLGINPNELGSAWKSAASSFVMFSLGAAIPLLPWIAPTSAVIPVSLGLAIIAALAIGAYLGFVSNGRWIRAALRQLFVLILAASITYGVGRLFNTTVL
jgi:VIT1/CCC1 family predicted Fe2+/Mn2+ transporter